MSAVKVLLVSNAGWNLYNYRLPIIRKLQEADIDVGLVCPRDGYADVLERAGFRVIEWRFERRSLNPFQETLAIWRLMRIYRREQPDLVHDFTIKPNMYGVVAARLARVPRVVNTWTGLGFVFGESYMGKVVRLASTPLLRRIARTPRVWSVYQTPSDLETMVRMGFAERKRSSIILGSGVDTEAFRPGPRSESEGTVVLMACRLIWEKGVREFVEAARILKERGTFAKFQLAGSPDRGNPGSLTNRDIQQLRTEDSISFLDHQNDMPALLRQASIAALPTFYNEGVPRFLLEASATGIPIVAADIPGCSEVVENGVNGLLVPPQNAHALADALEKLIGDAALRKRMGDRGRQIAVTRFDERLIVREYLEIYRTQGLTVPENQS